MLGNILQFQCITYCIYTQHPKKTLTYIIYNSIASKNLDSAGLVEKNKYCSHTHTPTVPGCTSIGTTITVTVKNPTKAWTHVNSTSSAVRRAMWIASTVPHWDLDTWLDIHLLGWPVGCFLLSWRCCWGWWWSFPYSHVWLKVLIGWLECCLDKS